MSAPSQSLLVAVQWGDERAARPCEFIDRDGFRVTMPFDPKVGQVISAWFRDAESRGTGFEVRGLVSSVYHAFDDDEGHRLVIAFHPGTAADAVDRILAMGVRHGIADRHLLPKTISRTPRPSGNALGAVVHTPQLGRDGIGRAHLRGTRRVWALDRLRPGEAALALGELLDGTFMLPNVQLSPDELNQVVLKLSLDGHSVMLPCEVRYQVDPGQGPAGAVLALGRVPVVLRARLADELARARHATASKTSRTSTAGEKSAVAPPRTGEQRAKQRAERTAERVGRRLGKPRPSRARDRLVREASGPDGASPAPARTKLRKRTQTDPAVRITRTPLPKKTLSQGPIAAPPVSASPAPKAPRPVALGPLPGTTLPPVRRDRAVATPLDPGDHGGGARPSPSPAPAAQPQTPPAAGATAALEREDASPSPAAAVRRSKTLGGPTPSAAIRKPVRSRASAEGPGEEGAAPPRDQAPLRAPDPTPGPAEQAPPGGAHRTLAAAMLLGTTPPPKAAARRTLPVAEPEPTPAAGVVRRRRGRPSDD